MPIARIKEVLSILFDTHTHWQSTILYLEMKITSCYNTAKSNVEEVFPSHCNNRKKGIMKGYGKENQKVVDYNESWARRYITMNQIKRKKQQP